VVIANRILFLTASIGVSAMVATVVVCVDPFLLLFFYVRCNW